MEIDEEFITHAYRLAKEKLYPLLKEKLNCDGLTIVQNNFYGPMVQHFHFHLTPRYKNDDYKEISIAVSGKVQAGELIYKIIR